MVPAADWTPLADVDAMPGDPDGIADLGRRLRSEAQRIRGVAARLRSVNARDFWAGDAADEFAARVGRAAPDLDLAAGRIETTATALTRYLQAIGDCQARGRTAVLRARDADAEIARAQAGLEAAANQAVKDIAAAGVRGQEGTAVPAPPTTSWGPNWNSLLEEAQQARADAVRMFNAAVQDYDRAVRRCVADLGPAVHDALTDPVHHGLFNRVVHAVESGVSTAVHTVEDVNDAVAHVAETVNENVVEWSHHHFFTLDGISESLGIAAAVAAFVPGAEGVALALSASKAAFDYGLYKAGKKDFKDVRDDLIGTAAFGAGRMLTGFARARVATKAAQETLNASERAARLGRDLQQAEHAEQAVQSELRAQVASARGEIHRFKEITETLGEGTSPSWWKESSRAFRHLDLKLPGEEALKIDRLARYTAKSADALEDYSKAKDAAELVKTSAEAVTGAKPKGPMIGDYELL